MILYIVQKMLVQNQVTDKFQDIFFQPTSDLLRNLRASLASSALGRFAPSRAARASHLPPPHWVATLLAVLRALRACRLRTGSLRSLPCCALRLPKTGGPPPAATYSFGRQKTDSATLRLLFAVLSDSAHSRYTETVGSLSRRPRGRCPPTTFLATLAALASIAQKAAAPPRSPRGAINPPPISPTRIKPLANRENRFPLGLPPPP
jgi:hypothetical protein